MPFAVDFACFVLSLCEKHCDLVSSSGMLRVDLTAAEWKPLLNNKPSSTNKASIITQEQDLRNSQSSPQEWSLTGGGGIVRYLLNEVRFYKDLCARHDTSC
jgi:hypothetical protein